MLTIATGSENGNNPIEHYFGTRKDSSKIFPSKNVYDYIKRMNLGNLSGLPKIPQYYLQFLLDYISQVSVSLAHAHKHDLVHTNLCLTKILIQNSDSFKKHINFEKNK